MQDSDIEKTVYFVRHGQSEDNIAPVFQSPDSPLSEKGRQQAARIAERTSRLSFEALIASPYERTRQTAEVIAETTGKEIEFSDFFVERVKPSYINGKPYEDAQANILWRKWEKSLFTPNLRVEDGENFDDLVVRADNALAYLQKRTERTMMVVTHGYFLRTIIARVLLGDLLSGEAFRRFQRTAFMENTGITVLRYHSDFEDKLAWRFWIYNDHAHLG